MSSVAIVAMPAGAAEQPDCVRFEHPFFAAAKDAYFRISVHTGEPVFVIRLAELEAVLSFPGIIREFHIGEAAHDAAMLDLVANGLRFVAALRLGDPIPSELRSGKASWSISERHREIALQRLTMQLVTWITGDERAIVDPDELLQLAEDPLTRRRADEAIVAAAERLGIGADRRTEVVDLIGACAEEIAFIEALRDQHFRLAGMRDRIMLVRRRAARERSVLAVADSVARLMTVAIAGFAKAFEDIDAQTGEILAILKNVEGQRAFIRRARDDLYCRLHAWSDIVGAWERFDPGRPEGQVDLLRRTWQFLAPRYMQVDQWVLATKPGSSGASDGKRDIPNSMRW